MKVAPNQPLLSKFTPGDRVRQSKLGRERSPRTITQLGTVTGLLRGSQTVAMRFDGQKSPKMLHVSYLELAAAEPKLKAKE